MKKFLLITLSCLAGAVAAPHAARAAECGLPDASPLWIEFSDGSVQFRDQVFGRPGVIAATRGTGVAGSLRSRGAKTVYWEMDLYKFVGKPDTPADPATVVAAADRLFDQAAASSACFTPWIALNELLRPTEPTPWSAPTAQYRADVLALLQRLAARGARPFLLVPSNPKTPIDSPGWWLEVAKVADIVREVYLPAPAVVSQGPLLGSRGLRIRMRTAARVLLDIGVPPSRIGIMLGFQSTGVYGRVRLQPLSAWLEFVKLNVLAAKQIVSEVDVGTIWSWGWGTFAPPTADPDKPAAACVYLWTRDPSLCDISAVAPPDFERSLTEGQIALAPGVQCSLDQGTLTTRALDEATLVLGSRAQAHTALLERVVQRAHLSIPAAQLLAAESRIVTKRFSSKRSLYRAELARRKISLAFARSVIADELRRSVLVPQVGRGAFSQTTEAEQATALQRATCLADDLPSAGDVRIASKLPFLSFPSRSDVTGHVRQPLAGSLARGIGADAAVPIKSLMDRMSVECLCCGQRRIAVPREGWRAADIGECPRCGYLGWASSSELTERSRAILRQRPPEQRRLYAV